MNSIFIFILILILFYVYLYLSKESPNEKFMVYWSGSGVSPIPDIDYMYDYPNYPFWNMRFGQTSNMSYDLRGDPIIIPKYPFMWNYSTLTPIYNKKLS